MDKDFAQKLFNAFGSVVGHIKANFFHDFYCEWMKAFGRESGAVSDKASGAVVT